VSYPGATFEEQRQAMPADDWRRAMTVLVAARKSRDRLRPWQLAVDLFGSVNDDSRAKARVILQSMEAAGMVDLLEGRSGDDSALYLPRPSKLGGDS